MKKIILFAIANFCFSIFSSAQTWQWTHPEPNGVALNSYPDPYGVEDDHVHDIETDAAGNVYVLGNFMDSLYLGNNFITKNNGSYLAKYDSTGKLLWYKLIIPTSANPEGNGGAPIINATDLTVNTTGVYITGKYLQSGYANYDCSTGTGTLILRSYSIGGFNLNSSAIDNGLFIAKFNTNGTFVWNKTGQDPYFCDTYNNPTPPFQLSYSPMITSDNAGNIVCGFVVNSVKGSVLINSDIISLRATDLTPPASPYPNYLVVAKYNGAGTLQWGANAGGGFNVLNSSNSAYKGIMQDCSSLITDKNNNIFFLGAATDSTFFGSQLFRINGTNGASAFISKISSAGLWQFAKELTNNPDIHSNGSIESPENLAVDSSNNVYAVVPYSGNPQVILGTPVAGGTSNYLVKMKNNGTLTWIKPFGSNFGNTYHHSIHYNNGNLYFCGEYYAYYYGVDQKLVFSQLYTPWVGGGIATFLFYAAKADLDGNFNWVTTFEDGGYSSNGNAIKAFNGNIYVGGDYQYKITSLGNLNGTFTNPPYAIVPNLFFGKLKDQYVRVGAVTPTNIIPGCIITVPFTSTGLTFSAGNTFTAELSDVNGYFNSPIAIGSVSSTGTGSITATIPASLTYGSGYRIRIHSSDTLKTGLGYYAYADTGYKLSLVCPAPSSGFTATNITGTTATVNWTAIGCAAGYKVQYRVKGTTAWTTAPVITTNTPTINLSVLTANTIYQWRVATRCKNNGTNSFSAYTTAKQFITAAAFASSVNAENISAPAKDFNIYPNPATSTLNIAAQIKFAGKVMIRITDMEGKVVYQQTPQSNGKSLNHNINISKLSPGAYIVELITGNEVRNGKFIKE